VIVRFGSLADLSDDISLMSALGCIADVKITENRDFQEQLTARSREQASIRRPVQPYGLLTC